MAQKIKRFVQNLIKKLASAFYLAFEFKCTEKMFLKAKLLYKVRCPFVPFVFGLIDLELNSAFVSSLKALT